MINDHTATKVDGSSVKFKSDFAIFKRGLVLTTRTCGSALFLIILCDAFGRRCGGSEPGSLL